MQLLSILFLVSIGVPHSTGFTAGGARYFRVPQISRLCSRNLAPLLGDSGGRFSMSDQSTVTKEKALNADFAQAQSLGIILGEKLTKCTVQKQALPEKEMDALKALLSHSDGARGFYVTTLTMPEFDSAFPSEGVSPSLKSAVVASAEPNAKLLTMNLAMSTAMILAHKENGSEEFAAGSELTQCRTKAVISSVLADMPRLRLELRALLAAASGEKGEDEALHEEYAKFLTRWGYGEEQRKVIAKVIADQIAGVL